MNQRRAKQFRKIFIGKRQEYRYFKKRYTRAPLPLKLEVIKQVATMKGKTIHHVGE